MPIFPQNHPPKQADVAYRNRPDIGANIAADAPDLATLSLLSGLARLG
jgi:hypothetical protein